MIECLTSAVAHEERSDRPEHLACELVELSAAQVRNSDYTRAETTLRRADYVAQRKLFTGLAPALAAKLGLKPSWSVRSHLRYEIAVRLVAVGLFTTRKALLGDEPVVGIARRRLPVVPNDDRVDPELEFVLEIIGMVLAHDMSGDDARLLLRQLLVTGAVNPPPEPEFWVHDALDPEPAAAYRLLLPP
jgi:hypothetical protein